MVIVFLNGLSESLLDPGVSHMTYGPRGGADGAESSGRELIKKKVQLWPILLQCLLHYTRGLHQSFMLQRPLAKNKNG